MTDLVPYQPTSTNGWVELLTPAADLAAKIANTEFVPAALRGNPAKVTACVLFGAELGIGPMQALAKVDVIDGRPAPKAELARALVLAAGHEMWVENQTNTTVTVAGRRKGSDIIQRVTWTMDDAKRAGLDGKQNWRKWPRQMLVARASSELARMSFPDCLGGISYFAEELEDDNAPTAAPVEATTAPKGKVRKLAPAAATGSLPTAPVVQAAPADDLPPLPDEIDDQAPEPITDPQMKMMQALMTKLHVTERDDRLALTGAVIDRQVTSARDLTKHEATVLIDRLVAVDNGTADIVFDDGIPTIVDTTAGAA